MNVITTPAGNEKKAITPAHGSSSSDHGKSLPQRKRQINTWISSDNCSDADEQPPPKKKGRPGNVECGHVCTPCVLWSDSSLASQTPPLFEIGRRGGSLVNRVDFSVPAKEFGRRCWYEN